MRKLFLSILVLQFLAVNLLLPLKVSAIENPIARPNNFFGIHILDENDLDDAAKLINSSGGDWGYAKPGQVELGMRLEQAGFRVFWIG